MVYAFVLTCTLVIIVKSAFFVFILILIFNSFPFISGQFSSVQFRHEIERCLERIKMDLLPAAAAAAPDEFNLNFELRLLLARLIVASH